MQCAAKESQAPFHCHVGKRGHPDTALTSDFLLYDECNGTSESCREPMHQMRLSRNTSTLLWPKFHTRTSVLELYMPYTTDTVATPNLFLY